MTVVMTTYQIINSGPQDHLRIFQNLKNLTKNLMIIYHYSKFLPRQKGLKGLKTGWKDGFLERDETEFQFTGDVYLPIEIKT